MEREKMRFRKFCDKCTAAYSGIMQMEEEQKAPKTNSIKFIKVNLNLRYNDKQNLNF